MMMKNLNTNELWIVKWGILGLKRKNFNLITVEEKKKEFEIENIVNIFTKSQYIFDVKVGKQKNTFENQYAFYNRI